MIKDLVKNLVGFTTKRKLLVISVDDYGNVRIGSQQALQNLEKNGLKKRSIFDQYDALETEEDLLMLFGVLDSVRDINNRPACFTPYALSGNIDFERIIESGYQAYFFESLKETFEKLNEFKTYELIKEGIRNKVYLPQYHGREHVNVSLFEKLLAEKNKSLMLNIENRSFAMITDEEGKSLPYSIAFHAQDQESLNKQKEIIQHGTKVFQDVYGYSPSNFMPPSATASLELNNSLFANGIRFFDSYRFRNNPSAFLKKEYIYTGKKVTDSSTSYLVRNVVFEPCHNKKIDAVGTAIQQIKAAFMMGKPAIVSSHRVNFCGRIDEENRTFGLNSLKRLLKEVKKRWPEVEFVSAAELGEIITDK